MARRVLGAKHSGGKKTRKYGRNKVFCNRYLLEGRREKNKARKARKEAKRRGVLH